VTLGAKMFTSATIVPAAPGATTPAPATPAPSSPSSGTGVS
jgi:hypothetical protein